MTNSNPTGRPKTAREAGSREAWLDLPEVKRRHKGQGSKELRELVTLHTRLLGKPNWTRIAKEFGMKDFKTPQSWWHDIQFGIKDDTI